MKNASINFNTDRNGPQSSLDELIQIIKETPISTVVGHYLPLHRKGPTITAICPFHQDSRPSLNVSDKKNMFKCFACNAAGDSISFVRDLKKLEFVDALKELAQILGLDFSQYQKREGKNPKIELAHKILSRASTLYRKLSEQNSETFQHFCDKRNISQETAKKFALGVSIRTNALCDYLLSIPQETERKRAIEMALELGLIKNSTHGTNPYFDVFRERIMFPIFDQQGQVTGFTSRATREEQIPKYLNSKDSFLFNKKNLLYGLHLAKPSIREKDCIILCEGNMDVVALHQFGLTYSVAIMGTALSNWSIRILRQLSKNIYFALDSDAAGKAAMMRSLPLLAQEGINPKVLVFAPHKDPDEYLNNMGPLAMEELIEKAPFLIDVLIQDCLTQLNDSASNSGKQETTPEQKINTLHKIFAILAPYKTELMATERILSAAKVMDLRTDSAIIIEDYKHFLQGQIRPIRPLTQGSTDRPKAKVDPQQDVLSKIKTQSGEIRQIGRNEKKLLQVCLHHPEILAMDKQLEILDFVGDDEVKRFVGKMRDLSITMAYGPELFADKVYDLCRQENFSSAIEQLLSDTIWAETGSVNMAKFQLMGPSELLRFLSDLKKRMQEDQLKTKRKEILERQKFTETINGQELQNREEQNRELMQELLKIDRQLLLLKSSSLKTTGTQTN